MERDLGLPVVLQAGQALEEQQRLVGRAGRTGQLADAVELGEQALAVQRYRGRLSKAGFEIAL